MCLISPISCVRLINEWQRDDCSQSRVACRDFLELWLLKKNSRVCHTASIQNPLKDTMFQEFQYVTVARSLSDRFS